MKKVIIAICGVLVIGVCCLFLFSGNDSNVKTTKNDNKKSGLTLTYQGVDITPGVSFDKTKINKTAEESEITSCAFGGTDHVYRYDDVEIIANVTDDGENVYQVIFLNENASTNEGVKIGSSTEDIKKAYPDVQEEDESYFLEKDDVRLFFLVDNDKVQNIEYTFIIK